MMSVITYEGSWKTIEWKDKRLQSFKLISFTWKLPETMKSFNESWMIKIYE